MPYRLKWYPYFVVLGFFAAAIGLQLLIPYFHWEKLHVYMVLNGLGGGVAILLGMVLYLIRPFRKEGDFLTVSALSFIVMGEAQLVGILTENHNVSAWLDCESVVSGGLLLLLVWLPKSLVGRLATNYRAIAAFVGLGLMVPLAMLVAGENRLPPAVVGSHFTVLVKALTILSGFFYLAACPRISQVTAEPERRLIVLMALFLGLGGLSFFAVRMWGLKWWLIQVMQFVPFLYALAYLMRIFLRNQSALFESEMRFRTLFNESPLGIGVVGNSRYSFMQANPALTKLLGYSEAELAKLNLKSLTHPDDLYHSFDERNRLLRGDIAQYTTERRYITKDKRELWLKVHGALFKTSRRGGYEFRLVEDVTQDKLDQEKIKQLAEDLSDANLKLKHFASVASHDLKAPLSTISNFVQLIARRVNNPTDRELAQYIHFVVEACKRMRSLIDDILVHARLDDSALQLVPVDCAEVVDEVLANLKANVETNHAKVTHSGLPVVQGDRIQLSQLFQNLVDNAIKYRGDQEPSVTLAVENREKDLLFKITDNGLGFPMQYAEKIFNAFERLHSDKAAGSGLGLPICKSIVKRHGGKIWAQSEPGQGSTFFFTLPKAVPLQRPVQAT